MRDTVPPPVDPLCLRRAMDDRAALVQPLRRRALGLFHHVSSSRGRRLASRHFRGTAHAKHDGPETRGSAALSTSTPGARTQPTRPSS